MADPAKIQSVRRGMRIVSTLALVALLALLLVPLASADNVKNDVGVVVGNDTITVGGATNITYYIQPTPADSCDASDGSSATVTINVPVNVTATPGSLVFSACDTSAPGIQNGQAVQFTAGVAGDYPITVSVSDSSGSYNESPAAFTLHVLAPTPYDTTPPAISFFLNPATPDGNNGWYKSDVTLTWSVSEPASPASLVKTGCVDQNVTADQAETTYSCSATSDGGSAGPVDVTIKRDATAPDVSLVGGPADGASYYFGSVPAEPTCSASDATSGLAGACSVSSYSTAVGSHTVTASATDNAGNEGSDSANYTVLAWTLNGFYQPVDMNGVFNVVKGGSTVPLKFEVFAGSTELTDTSVVKSFVQTKIACDGTTPTDEIEVSSTGGTSLRYDSTSGQFIQNWQTPKAAGTCYRVTMTTQDGSSLVALFKLK